MAKRTIGILGLGIFGIEIVNTLKNYDCDIIAVDNREEHISEVGHCLTQGIIGDITDYSLLQAAGIDTCDVVIVATGSKLEASVLAVMHCKKLGVSRVIAKALNETTTEVLIKVGADKVISPEKEMGITLAKQILYRKTVGIFNIDKHVSLAEFFPPQIWQGKTLLEVDPRKTYQLNLIGFRNESTGQLDIQLTPDYIFSRKESIIAVTDSRNFDHFVELTDLDGDLDFDETN